MKIASMIFAGLFIAQYAGATTPAPVTSKEDVVFAAKKDHSLLGFANPESFLGYFTRTGESDVPLRQAELYSFNKITSLKMDEPLCKKALEMIYGPLQKITLKVRDVKMWSSHTGSTCEATVIDPTPRANPLEYRTEVGFINAKPYGIVFKLPQKSTAKQQDNIRSFWESLR